jgi:hypothetical protein
MTYGGKTLQPILLVLGLFLLPFNAWSAITTEVDRIEVALGETLRLTIRSDAGEQPNDLDLSGIERDFEILQRSSSTSARLVGGQQSVTRTLELDLAPRRDGVMTIPPLVTGGKRTTPIAIKVSPEPIVAPGDELVLFDSAVDKTDVYVQAQLILTVTLQQAINLDNRTITELDIPDIYVEPLEQKSFQRRIAGRLWQVTELRYALFPQKSGVFEIPALAFSGRELLPGRSLLGARLGRRIALDSRPITVDVKPVPASFPGEVWLPASRLTLTSQWSAAPNALVTGDSTTRTLELTAEGLQGSQLPPLTSLGGSSSLDGLRFYPDKETIDQREVPAGLEGYRLQSEALVAIRTGNWELPPLSIPWWNTETDTLEFARLPEETIAVSGVPTLSNGAADLVDTQLDSGINNPERVSRFWRGATALGWLLAAVFAGLWLRLRRRLNTQDQRSGKEKADGSKALVQLRLACSSNDPEAARQAVLNWFQDQWENTGPVSLSDVSNHVEPALAKELRRLDAALYRREAADWTGDRLFGLVKKENSRSAKGKVEAPALSLYPAV